MRKSQGSRWSAVLLAAVAALSGCGGEKNDTNELDSDGGIPDGGVPEEDAAGEVDAAGDAGRDAPGPAPEGGDATEPRGPTGVFVVVDDPLALAGETFFDHPWPSDLRLSSNGTVPTSGYPNPRNIALFSQYIASIDGVLDGFSPVAPGYLRFTDPVDVSSLPATPVESESADSSVQLLDVDPDSPARGQRRQIILELHNERGVHWPENTLAFATAYGEPLRPGTTYALVVTTSATTQSGESFSPSADLEQVLGLAEASGGTENARARLAPAVAEVVSAGIARSDIAHLAVFTTNDPTENAFILRDHVIDEYPAPTVDGTSWAVAAGAVSGVMDVYEGEYSPSPDYQAGDPPYLNVGGAIALLPDGTPDLQREFDARFVLVVPDPTACPMPAEGYPIVLYAHGTGGDYRSSVRDGTAQALAGRCIATIGVDQIFQGTREGSDVDANLSFLNLSNLAALRGNAPQSATDVVQLARLFSVSDARIPAAIAVSGTEVLFDATKLMFFGHSQGAINGPIFLAADDSARGAVLSGGSSYVAMGILDKTLPLDMKVLVAGLLMLTEEETSELTRLHPVLALAQSIIDPSDPIHYAPLIAEHPRSGFFPKSLLLTEGINPDGTGDTYAPPQGVEVFAIAAGVPPQEPIISPILPLAWSSLTPVTIGTEGLSGNIGGGRASGILAQWSPLPNRDGHFVVFDVPEATAQATGFLQNLAADPVGRVPAP